MSVAGTGSPRYRPGPPEPTSLFPDLVGPDRRIEGGERDRLDAYWTPRACAVACCQAIVDAELDFLPALQLRRVLEPAVGGGSFARAAQEVFGARVHRLDIDPLAPGLHLLRKLDEAALVGDFMNPGALWTEMVGPLDAVIGNRPYAGGAVAWLERSLSLAPVVAYLERSTILGSRDRAPWWLAHPPACVWTLSPRPRWQGPGGRDESDMCDSVLVLWVEGQTDTRHRWLPWVPA